MSDAASSPWRHLPNLISVARIALVLPVGLSILQHRFEMALWLALVAGLSDALDGWLARRFGWRSRLGGLLDPAADKLLLVTCYLTLAAIAAAPAWLAALVVVRDLTIIAGALAYRRLVGPFRARPSWISKCCTAAQILYVLAVLLRRIELHGLELGPLVLLVAALTVASGVDYVARWSIRARRQWRVRRPQDRESRHDT